jgi:DNA invertase Pin-like site-specific DNA recombinase
MGKIVAYLRASTDKQDLSHQKLELLEFARNKFMKIDSFIEITISSRKTSKQRRIDELLQTLDDADTLVVTELSRLGRSTACKKTQGIKLGKPKGTLQKSKFDKDIEKIRELLGYGLSIRKIAKVLGYTRHISLNTNINKRSLRQIDL